jgi:hypothetical protein
MSDTKLPSTENAQMIAVKTKEALPVAKEKPLSKDDRIAKLRLDASGNARIELVADPEWVLRLDDHAAALGLSRSAYVRMAVTKIMDREDRDSSQSDS